jgi:hypothetical protein
VGSVTRRRNTFRGTSRAVCRKREGLHSALEFGSRHTPASQKEDEEAVTCAERRRTMDPGGTRPASERPTAHGIRQRGRQGARSGCQGARAPGEERHASAGRTVSNVVAVGAGAVVRHPCATAGASAGAPNDLSESPTAMAVGRTVALSHSSVLSTTAARPLVSAPAAAAASTPAPPAPSPAQLPAPAPAPAPAPVSHGCRVAGREPLGLATIALRQRHGNGKPARRFTTNAWHHVC